MSLRYSVTDITGCYLLFVYYLSVLGMKLRVSHKLSSTKPYPQRGIITIIIIILYLGLNPEFSHFIKIVLL